MAIIGAQTAFAAVILITYGVLMARKRALFVLKEGSGQSMTAVAAGLAALLFLLWGHMQSSILPSLSDVVLTGESLGSITYYSVTPEHGIGVPILLQACALSLSIAFGFSARAVRNRLLMLANVGLLAGFIALLVLYAPLVLGEIRIPFF
jgi:hypothetical protein